ncbi:MAG: hypothetical protein AAF492_20780, partial [Verrucomicrobiota bacterium]
GVEEPWEVCLIKLMVEVIRQSASGHFTDLQRDPHGVRHEIERAFRAAAKDRSRISELSQLLKQNNLFEEYEDRFFSLVRS